MVFVPFILAKPVELPHNYNPQSKKQDGAPWYLAALTADPASIEGEEPIEATKTFYYRTMEGINIYMIGPPVDTNFDEIRGLVNRDDHWVENSPRGDTSATYAAALAVGRNRGVAKGAHLETISTLPFTKTLPFAELNSIISKILKACNSVKVICIVALPYSFWDAGNGIIQSIDRLIAAKVHVVARARLLVLPKFGPELWFEPEPPEPDHRFWE
ncbi:hypothetical protein H0H93_004241 [Arthromyces matolae]|nr:hypothetical protein H0H93_004241 [Arthromyces matolae]